VIKHLKNVCVYAAARDIEQGPTCPEIFAVGHKVLVTLESKEEIKVEIKKMEQRSDSDALGIGIFIEGSTDSAKKDDCVSFDLRL
jgi:hypothetical protein